MQFNGKNIISKNINFKGNKKSNGTIPNLELLKELYEQSIKNNSENNTTKNKPKILNSEKKIKIINIHRNNLINDIINNKYEENTINTINNNINNEKEQIELPNEILNEIFKELDSENI